MNKKNFKVLIIACWVVLAICLVIKLFGGNWFELATNNTKFIKFCEWIENNQVPKMILYCIIAILTTYPALCVFINKKYLNLKESLIFIPLIAIKSIVGWYISGITIIFDFLTLIIVPLIIVKFKYWKRIIIGNLLVILFQIITIVVRNLNPNIAIENLVVEALLYQIDYYVMIALFYLYNTYFKLYNIRKE